jgi:hypothetical protein
MLNRKNLRHLKVKIYQNQQFLASSRHDIGLGSKSSEWQGAVRAGAVLAPALTAPAPTKMYIFGLNSSQELLKFDLYPDCHLPLRSINFDRINFDPYKF